MKKNILSDMCKSDECMFHDIRGTSGHYKMAFRQRIYLRRKLNYGL